MSRYAVEIPVQIEKYSLQLLKGSELISTCHHLTLTKSCKDTLGHA